MFVIMDTSLWFCRHTICKELVQLGIKQKAIADILITLTNIEFRKKFWFVGKRYHNPSWDKSRNTISELLEQVDLILKIKKYSSITIGYSYCYILLFTLLNKKSIDDASPKSKNF